MTPSKDGSLPPDGKQVPLDADNMKYFLEGDEDILRSGQCFIPKELQDAIDKVKEQYKFK